MQGGKNALLAERVCRRSLAVCLTASERLMVEGLARDSCRSVSGTLRWLVRRGLGVEPEEGGRNAWR